MKKTLKLFIGACLATCAAVTPAQDGSLVTNGSFDMGDGTAVTTEYAGQVTNSGLSGWDVVTGNSPVHVAQSSIGPSGTGDASVVVYDDGAQGGITQTVTSDAPYLRISADVFVQYGGASLATTSPAGEFNLVDGTNVPNQWVTLSGVIPNVGGANAVEILSSDANGSSFAVDNVVVEPVYDAPTTGDSSSNVFGSAWMPGPTYLRPTDDSFESNANAIVNLSAAAPEDTNLAQLSSTAASLRSLMSLYDMANNYGYPSTAYDVGYVPSSYTWPY